MSYKKNWLAFCGSGAIVAAMAAPIWAQSGTGESQTGQTGQSQNRDAAGAQSRQGGQPGQSGTAGGRAAADSSHQGGGQLDQHIAACLLLGNQEEVALAQLAQERAQNEEVKKFAQHMIEQHQQAISQIQQASPQLAALDIQLTSTGASGADASATAGGASSQGNQRNATNSGANSSTASASGAGSQDAARANQTTAATGGTGTSGAGAHAQGADHQSLQLAKDIKQQCLQLTSQELSQKQGAEFDKAYIGQQVGAHMNMLAELRASQKYAGQELQPVIQQGEQMTQQHLAQAKQIMEQIKDQQGATASSQATQPGAAQPRR